MDAVVIHHWSEVPAEEAAGVRRAAIAGSGVQLKRVEIPAGTVAPRHEHPFEQLIQVIAGTATLTTAAGTARLVPGTVVRLAPHTWHAAEFEADTVLVEVNLPEAGSGT